MKEPPDIFELIVETDEAGIEPLAELIGKSDFTVELPQAHGNGNVSVKMQFTTRQEAETLLKKLRAGTPGRNFKVNFRRVPGRRMSG